MMPPSTPPPAGPQVLSGDANATAPQVPPAAMMVTYQAGPTTTADGYAAVSRLLLRGLAAGLPPAVAMTSLSSGGFCYRAAGGWASLGDAATRPVPATAQTLFDLASLTKVVVTVPLVLLLHQRGSWGIDDPVARWLPGAARSPVTLRQCLTHTSGLVAHRPFYAQCADPAAIRRAVIAELATAAGGPVLYSDLNFMLLGWAVESCAGERLDALARREVLAPLGMLQTTFLPQVHRTAVAATEADSDQRPGAGPVWGQVHDGNAYALGGVSGHAGLFSTAGDLALFAGALLRPDRHPVLSEQTVALMSSRQASTRDDVRALGWRLRPSGWGSWPPDTIWHTGFTGTSLLISPGLDSAVVLLTNAVHPVRRLPAAGRWRAAVHRAARRAVRPAEPG